MRVDFKTEKQPAKEGAVLWRSPSRRSPSAWRGCRWSFRDALATSTGPACHLGNGGRGKAQREVLRNWTEDTNNMTATSFKRSRCVTVLFTEERGRCESGVHLRSQSITTPFNYDPLPAPPNSPTRQNSSQTNDDIFKCGGREREKVREKKIEDKKSFSCARVPRRAHE